MAFIDSKTKPGRHRVGWRDLSGKQRWQDCKTITTARQVERAIENSLAVGRDWNPKAARGEPDLVKEVGALYFKEIEPERADSTLRRYGLDFRLFEKFLRVEHPRGKLGVSLLSKDTMIDFATWLRQAENGLHKRKRGEDAVRKIVETIEVFWAWAYEREKWDIPLPKKLKLKRTPAREPRAPTWAEMDAAISVANGWMKQLMTWLRYTGIRPTESTMVLWSDINMQTGKLHVRSDLIGNKTRKERTVPLSPHLIEELATWGVREGFVIPQGRSKKPRDGVFRRADDMTRVWKRSGVPEDRWKRQPDKAFRVGVKTGLLSMGLMREAIDYVQGHQDAAASARYVAGSHLPLQATVEAIPRIGITNANVVQLPRTAAGSGA
jgi:integrase